MPLVAHVIGTGTIGEPLIGLLADHKSSLGIDEVTFHKRTPLLDERAKVKSLIARGAQLCVDRDAWSKFKSQGYDPTYDKEEALARATVVIDCTPAGNANKESLYGTPLCKNVKGFIAQGSEHGFGRPYAYGINDRALGEERFVQVVSCNTHNMAAMVNTLAINGAISDLASANFVCIRRANDISQSRGFVASPEVSPHNDKTYGTHHARDVSRLFLTMGHDMAVYSSALKVNTQYMHSVWFRLELNKDAYANQIDQKIRSNKFVAITHKRCSNKIFSFGRDHGYYGRILNHSVLAMPTLEVRGRQVVGFCFTPQDGNSLLSSVAATVRFMHPADYEDRLSVLSPYLFDEI